MHLRLVAALVAAGALAPHAASAQGETLTPPALRTMPPVGAPRGEAPRAVQVRVLVRLDGRAELVECSAGDAACEAIAAALAEARFTPAQSGAEPVASRIALEVRLLPPAERWSSPEPSAEPSNEPSDEDEDDPAEPAEDAETDDPALGVSAEVTRTQEGARPLTAEEARETPGALGDPLRAVLTMPGVVPALDGAPYFYLRGAPPSGTTYDYDGIPLPVLYHFAGGPSVIHPRMMGDLQVHSGVAPARYGSHSGGVVVAGAPPPSDRALGEAELRLIDMNAYVHAPYDHGAVSAAVRIGYPGLLISLFSPATDLQYYDYQVRARHDLDSRTSVEMVGLGMFDIWQVTSQMPGDTPDSFVDTVLMRVALSVHRAELRLRSRSGPHHLLAALLVGHEESALRTDSGASEVGVHATRLGPRVEYELRERDLRVRIGGNLTATVGGLSDGLDGLGIPPELVPHLPSNQVTFLAARQRMMGTLFAELELEPLRGLHIHLGLRAGGWLSPGVYDASLDPRARVRWRFAPGWSVHAAAGVARQPATFFYPLPGLADLPLDQGMQTATQSEVGLSTQQRWDDIEVEADLRLFLNRFENLWFADLSVGVPAACTPEGLCSELPINPRSDGWSYGGELWAKASLGRHVAARLAYTLTRVESDALGPDVTYTPGYDVRHVWTLVLGWSSQDGWTAGITAFLRSGAVDGFTYATEQLALGRYEQRMPWFGRVDASVAYDWDAGWARLRVGIDFRNATFAIGGEPIGIDCRSDVLHPPSGPPAEACPVNHLPPIAAGTIGIRGTFR